MAHHIGVGDVTITRIVEQEAPFFPAREFFPALTADILNENRGWLEPRFLDPDTQNVMLCIQSYVVRSTHHTILIDTCVGNHKPRPARAFWSMMANDRYERNLSAAGIGFDDVDFVMCTHLHVDHVGWNTRLENGRWVPTFPRAKYVFADRELAFWEERHKANPEVCPWITDSVLPIIAARRAEVVRSDHVLDDTVKLIPTPGHTIDHFSVHVGKPDADAVITGDMIHSPIQARYPHMGMFSDHDSEQAAETRRSLFGRFAGTPTLMCTAHFPSPSIGRVQRDGNGFRFDLA